MEWKQSHIQSRFIEEAANYPVILLYFDFENVKVEIGNLIIKHCMNAHKKSWLTLDENSKFPSKRRERSGLIPIQNVGKL